MEFGQHQDRGKVYQDLILYPFNFLKLFVYKKTLYESKLAKIWQRKCILPVKINTLSAGRTVKCSVLHENGIHASHQIVIVTSEILEHVSPFLLFPFFLGLLLCSKQERHRFMTPVCNALGQWCGELLPVLK